MLFCLHGMSSPDVYINKCHMRKEHQFNVVMVTWHCLHHETYVYII